MPHMSSVTQIMNVPQHLCIHDLLEYHAGHTPDAPAIVAPGRAPLTYGRLYRYIDDVVETLRGMGLERNDRVALVLPNGPEMAVSFLAIAAGATCVPLNPAYTANEFDLYLADLRAEALIVEAGMDSAARAVAQARGIRIIELSPVLEAEAGLFTLVGEVQRYTARRVFAQPNDVALVLHTSGTTSQPKIVPLTHTNICMAAYNTCLALILIESDRCLQVMPLFHIYGLIATVLASLVAGASVVCTPGFDPHQFFAWIAEFHPTWYAAVPTIHEAILARATLHREVIEHCPLRFIRSSSAPLPQRVLAELERVFNAPVIETYGTTEISPISCNPPPQRQHKPGSVGMAVGLEVAIMDAAGTILPAGATGEIVVRGANVFQGYENDSTANRSAFTQGWFRTGDQGYLNADGYLFLTGRLKELINRGGEKIAPQEVDAVLMDHPAVAQATTFAVPDLRLGEEIAAAVVLRQNASVRPSDIRQFAARHLAPFKVPRQVLIVEDIPKSHTGKVQRTRLAEKLGLTVPEQLRPMRLTDYAAPRTPVEEVLASLWVEVLDIERVGIHDDFFQLGGDSLIATQLISRIRDTLHVEISFPSFFETPTVADMARSLEAVSRVMQASPMPLVPRHGTIPLSLAQERLWFLDQLAPVCAAYNIPVAVCLRGLLNVTALAQSLSEMVRRHEILRTTFPADNGRPVQAVALARPWTLPVVDLQEVPEHEREVQVRALARAEGQRPFELVRGPLLRPTLLRLAAEEHVLLLTLHHIISDAWSQGVFWRELGVLYEAFATGKPSPLPELGIQYGDFAIWQRQWLQGEVLDTQLAYWKEHLAGLSTLQLPTDRPRPPVQAFRGARHPVMFSPALLQGLKGLSQRHGATLFMTLLAAFQTLLHRYTGQDDVPVGSFIANRHWLETEGLLGFFVNTLVLRTDLSGNLGFQELLGRVREVTLDAYSHQDLPYEKLVEALRPPRDLSRNPLFQVLFALRNTPRQAPKLAGLTLSFLDVYNETAKFDLTLELGETPEGLSGWFEYNIDLFDAATIARMAGHFQTLLEGIVADPGQRAATLPLLTADERRQMLTEWNNTAADYPRDKYIHEVFEAQVAQTPNAVAFVYEGAQLTYQELNRRANQVAHHLRGLGVGPEVLVGLCMERSLEMVVGLLGVLKAGGAYVPLDPNYPQERLAFMLEDARVPVLLTQEHLAARLSDYRKQVICLDSKWCILAQQSDWNPVSGVTSDNLAYVLFTSGSTGRPKGVLGTHQAVMNALAWMWQAQPLTGQEVCCQKTSISFGDSIQELFGALLQGVQTILIPHRALQDPSLLVQTLAANRVTRIILVPSLLRMLLDTYNDLEDRLTSLKLWIAGGEALSSDLCRCFMEHMPQSRLINLYGPSEASDDTTWYETGVLHHPAPSVPIGRPIANTQIYLLDRYLQPVPIGVPGELHVGGLGLTRGYLNRPELTAERFIPNPFSSEPGARFYKTGDLARYLPDGTIEYLGRLDYQVKIRGFRMELGEIEAVLEQHPAICQAVVLAREEVPSDVRLVAYVVLIRDSTPAMSELRNFLKEKLPEYMVPSAFVVLEALPLTPSGKVDRKALPPPEVGRPRLEKAFVAPDNAIERQLTHLWEDLLGVKPIGRQDDFFELGGHSLLVVQLFAHIEKQMGIHLPLATLFQTPTIAHLAHCLRKRGEVAPGALPVEMPHAQAVSDRIRHPIARYLPSQYHPSVRRTYRRLKHSSLGRALRGLYIRQGKNMTQRLFSYTPMQLENTLKAMGITAGDTVLMHSAFRVFNGFAGTPDQVLACVLNVIGKSGNLAMVSMPYGGSTAAYLQEGVPFDVRRTRSAMGVITEIFRQTPGVVRSLNPAHPILAWGPAAPWLIAGHEHTMYSCGKGSPFEKLVHLQAKALFFDLTASFSRGPVSPRGMTFYHYLDDLFQDTLPVKLYEETPLESIVIDTSGNSKVVQTYVFSRAARRYRNRRNLREMLIKHKIMKSQKIGNTKLIVLELQQVVECAQQMVRAGKSLWKI
jgi:amino acid adenylation domain-containing protein